MRKKKVYIINNSVIQVKKASGAALLHYYYFGTDTALLSEWEGKNLMTSFSRHIYGRCLQGAPDKNTFTKNERLTIYV